MDAVIKKFMPQSAYMEKPVTDRPSEAEVEAAVRTLLRWTGDDPDREGLMDTPKRVAKAYREMFSGYDMCPAEELGRTFEEVAGYDDLVIVKDIQFHSHCEHHMVPIIGKAHVGYLPDGKVVGLSKIARVVDIFAHRLQTQEAMTAQIAGVIQDVLNPRGVAVMIEAEHMCMAMRGIRKQGSTTLTSTFTGVFKDKPEEQVRFVTMVRAAARLIAGRLRQIGPAMSALEFPKAFVRQEGAGGRRGVFAALRRQRPRHGRRHRRGRRHAADGRAHERRGAGADARDRHRPLLVALAQGSMEEGRNLRQFSACRRDAHRLRPGCDVAARQSVGPRRNLSHRPAFMLLSDGGAERRQGDASPTTVAAAVRCGQTYRKPL